MTILELRQKIVQVNELMMEINNGLRDLFLEQEGYIDCGSGYMIPKPKLPDKAFKNRAECDSCEERN